MTNLQLVDVMYAGKGYMLEAATKASGTKVGRSKKRLNCAAPTHNGDQKGAIKTNDYFLYCRGEGRMCIRCGLSLGALEPAEGQP